MELETAENKMLKGLKPCPLCKGEKLDIQSCGGWWNYLCFNCGLTYPPDNPFFGAESWEAARDKWNNRP